MSLLPFRVIEPSVAAVPILLSVPHCGTAFPEDLVGQYKPELIAAPDDTDWFVDRLYGFAPSVGITMIHSHFSRWVIDLNRDPNDKPLYTDGRIITGLCPTTNFLGAPIYKDARTEVAAPDVSSRNKKYYNPYHDQLQKELQKLKAKFGKVLLWECHSIRRVVSSISKTPLPDLILGDADGASASPRLIETALRELGTETYSLSHDHPFKGGYITRNYGDPSTDVNAIQLEMTKVNYMDDTETRWDEQRAARMSSLLMRTMQRLIKEL